MTFQDLLQKVLEADIDLDTEIVVTSTASLVDDVKDVHVSEDVGIILFY